MSVLGKKELSCEVCMSINTIFQIKKLEEIVKEISRFRYLYVY